MQPWFPEEALDVRACIGILSPCGYRNFISVQILRHQFVRQAGSHNELVQSQGNKGLGSRATSLQRLQWATLPGETPS
jgi:hypothetical protein